MEKGVTFRRNCKNATCMNKSTRENELKYSLVLAFAVLETSFQSTDVFN